MAERRRLPDAELAVMQAIWDKDGESARGDIEAALARHKWTANTINTYLARLCEKGYLQSRKEGRGNLYRPLVSRQSYLEFESRETLHKLYGGKLNNFIAALTAEQPLSQNEIDELRRHLDAMAKRG